MVIFDFMMILWWFNCVFMVCFFMVINCGFLVINDDFMMILWCVFMVINDDFMVILW